MHQRCWYYSFYVPLLYSNSKTTDILCLKRDDTDASAIYCTCIQTFYYLFIHKKFSWTLWYSKLERKFWQQLDSWIAYLLFYCLQYHFWGLSQIFFFNIGSVINELFFFSYKMLHQHHWLCRLVREVCSYKVYCLIWCRGSFTLNMCTSLFALLHNALFVNNNNRFFIVIIINCCLIFMTVFKGSTNF